MRRRLDGTTRLIPRTQADGPFVRVPGGTRTGSRPRRKRWRGCVAESDGGRRATAFPPRRPWPDDARSAAAHDLHVHYRSIHPIALQTGNVAKRPELSVQCPFQIADSPASESAPNQGDTDHGIVKRGHVSACVNGQPTATVLVPRHRAELSRPACRAGRRDERHSTPALGRGSQMPVYLMSFPHARPECILLGAASPAAVRPGWNGASGHQGPARTTPNEGVARFDDPATRRPPVPRA